MVVQLEVPLEKAEIPALAGTERLYPVRQEELLAWLLRATGDFDRYSERENHKLWLLLKVFEAFRKRQGSVRGCSGRGDDVGTNNRETRAGLTTCAAKEPRNTTARSARAITPVYSQVADRVS